MPPASPPGCAKTPLVSAAVSVPVYTASVIIFPHLLENSEFMQILPALKHFSRRVLPQAGLSNPRALFVARAACQPAR
ncbi:MAG: hypothetical protein DU429_05120 [Candidatus Tokpelaia sp.]|nr:MAG: hypothetical protein DU430_07930 [Candidatus Tokpelaia sp.]KAA6206843.1 MAG: hypothetical protein DU429_05120 [Candidatus Tokpelaia sp.]